MDAGSEKDGWRGFKALLAHIESDKDLEAFFALFLTHKEREEIAGRYLIVRDLVQGELTQRAIAKAHGISIANVSRGSNALKTIAVPLRRILEKFL